MKISSLDGVRGFAAVYVFFHHLNPLSGTNFEYFFKFGQEAVILFFLVSGFVISYSQLRSYQLNSIRAFIIGRVLRIYPIFLVSIALAALAAVTSGNSQCITASALIGNLLMLQDIGLLKSGTWVDPFCSNAPLWSLSYEWWFYVVFAILFGSNRLSMQSRRIIVAAMAIAGSALFLLKPSQLFLFASYFSIWWVGAELCFEYLQYKKISFQRQKFSIFLLVSCSAIWTIPVVKLFLSELPFVWGREPFLQLRHFGGGIVFFALAIVAAKMPVLMKRMLKMFGFIAPLSYGLYATHQPVIDLVRRLNLGFELTLAATVFVAFLVAYFLEIIYQPRIAALVSNWGSNAMGARRL